ncbi:hypothetical protein SAMN06269185_3216 [Natronoarchaeum philippinense]|uniref:Uncharacterized protein n=1 Tax=Natronoarchaeum philippinense TaxID=558529 RepID=A0A285P9D8_NATPI|nr:hypothetical protein [Natronoarchaeum philippinense]SNZ18048.1 hypothetical protein SAMN06269185_3216 [Natronoarchaeum philippinense]
MSTPQTRTVGDVLAALPDNGSVLVSGAGRETLGRLPYQLLRSSVGVDDAAVIVTTEDAGDRLVRQFTNSGDSPARSRVGVVDATPSGHRQATPEDGIWSASSPVDFNGTGAGIDRCHDHLDGDAVHLLYDTLTTPLLSADSETVARYAHHVSLRVDDSPGIGLFPIHTNVTSERDAARLKHLFDAHVEVRKCGGERQVRCSGVDNDWCGWQDLQDGDATTEFSGIV